MVPGPPSQDSKRIPYFLPLPQLPRKVHLLTHLDSGQWNKNKILGRLNTWAAPLSVMGGLENIKIWLHSNQKATLWDLSRWGQDNSWIGWELGDVPHALKAEACSLLNALQGLSPISASWKDKRGWGSSSGLYSAAAGY